MSAQRPASPELGADDVADARYPNTARIWNYQLGGKDNFPVDRKASDAPNAMVRDISAPTGEDAAHDGRPLAPADGGLHARAGPPPVPRPRLRPAAAALNSGYHLAYLTGAGLVLVPIAVAVSFLRARVPEGAPEPEPVPEVPAEPVPGAATEPEAPWFRVKPLPAYAEAQVAGCQETGMRVVIGCGGCAGSAP
jgi:S-adenosyl methyltransferase